MPGVLQGRAQVMDRVVLVRRKQPQGRAQAAQQDGDHQDRDPAAPAPPSAIPSTPSSINSRICTAACTRDLSLLPAGRNSIFAEATPYTVATKATAIPDRKSTRLARCF